MFSILITDGIASLDLIKRILEQKLKPDLIITTCKYPDKTSDIHSLAAVYKELQIFSLDMAQVDTYPAFVKKVEPLVGHYGLNVLINNVSSELMKISFEDLTLPTFLENMQRNFYSPIFFTKAMLPLIKRAADVNASKPMGIQRAVIINISSTLGSIQENTSGHYWGFRESKAALNQVSRTLCAELQPNGIMVVVINPDLDRMERLNSIPGLGPLDSNVVEQNDDVPDLIDLIFNLKEIHNGKFLMPSGEEYPW